MTIQQLTILMIAAVGIALFFTGRIFAKKLSAERTTFMPASIITVRGLAAYFSTLVSCTGLLLAAICLFLLFN